MSPDAVEQELRELLDVGSLRVVGMERLEGGFSRETWLLALEGVPPDLAAEVVLRRDAAGGIVQTPLSIEYTLYDALAGAEVPIPRVLGASADGGRLARPFYVMTRSEGDGGPAAVLALDDPARERLAAEAMRALARLHRFDARALDVLDQRGAESGAGPHAQLRHWAGVLDSMRLGPLPGLDVAVAWLDEHAPEAADEVLVHGDFRTGNLLHTTDGGLTAVLDWELAHRGSAAEDLAWFCLARWRWSGDDRVGGLVGRQVLLDLYREHGGDVDDAEVRWWEVLGNLKLACFQVTSRFRLSRGEAVRPPTVRSSLYVEHQSLYTVEALLEAMETGR